MNTERKLRALDLVMLMVENYEVYDEDDVQRLADAEALLESLYSDVQRTQTINELTADWAAKRPDLTRAQVRKVVEREVRKASKVGA